MNETATAPGHIPVLRRELESAVVRFAGDSGDGMQLTGGQFTLETALAGNDLATFPDFPAEIRAPAGTTFGVSAFQINFGQRRIKTAGDLVDVLVAMNPAALKVDLKEVKPGGLLILDTGAFSQKNIDKAGFTSNPLTDGSLDRYRRLDVDMSALTMEAVKHTGLGRKDGLRCKNMWALGLVSWLFDRDRTPTKTYLERKFAKEPQILEANLAALNAGHAYGETAEIGGEHLAFTVPPARIDAGLYRNVTGTEALAWGLVFGGQLAGLPLWFCGYPITPASALLHTLANLKQFDVGTFQAEDEIAAIAAAIGASYAGSLGVTSSSGPGIALKTEAIGLAVAAELPLVIVNSQRGGPSTGLPTKTEQSDLYQAVFGRNADAPLPVIASRSPGDCFDCAIEAVKLAVTYMTPVIFLTDGYLANAAEPWKLPDLASYEPFKVRFHQEREGFQPFLRNADTLARVWAKPGTPGLTHRIGGIERDDKTGNISYDAENHHRMTKTRAAKVLGIADALPLQGVEDGETTGKLAIVGWGSTFGPISRAVSNLRAAGQSVSHIHLRHIWPLPKNLKMLLHGFDQVLIPEMNNGQLVTLLRAETLIDCQSLTKIAGRPFKIAEIEEAALALLENRR